MVLSRWLMPKVTMIATMILLSCCLVCKSTKIAVIMLLLPSPVFKLTNVTMMKVPLRRQMMFLRLLMSKITNKAMMMMLL